jgi:opacity protein-like surface antigen
VQITNATPASADPTDDAAIAGGATAVFSTILCGGVGQAFDLEESPEDEPYARRGWLLGVSGIYAADTKEGDLESTLGKPAGAPVNLSLKNTFGIKSQAGYRCHPRFSAEVEVEWLDDFEGTLFLQGPVGGKVSVDLEPLVVTTNLKGYLLTGRYQPFALIGGGAMVVEVNWKDNSGLGLSQTDTKRGAVMRFGGGLDFYATKQIVLTVGVDYLLPFGELQDFDYVSIAWGLRYRF